MEDRLRRDSERKPAGGAFVDRVAEERLLHFAGLSSIDKESVEIVSDDSKKSVQQQTRIATLSQRTAEYLFSFLCRSHPSPSVSSSVSLSLFLSVFLPFFLFCGVVVSFSLFLMTTCALSIGDSSMDKLENVLRDLSICFSLCSFWYELSSQSFLIWWNFCV